MSTYNAYRYRSNNQILDNINNSRKLYGMPELNIGVFRYLCQTRCGDIKPVTKNPKWAWLPDDAAEIEERVWDYEYKPHNHEKNFASFTAAKTQHDREVSLSRAEKTVMAMAAEVSGVPLEDYIWEKGLKQMKKDALKVFDILRNL